MIRCPNLRDDKGREAFNGVLERLGGLRMSVDDVTPRQPYLARLNEQQTRAYNISFYLWNEHKTSAEIGKFLDALDEVRAVLDRPSNEAAKSVEAKKTDTGPDKKAIPSKELTGNPLKTRQNCFT